MGTPLPQSVGPELTADAFYTGPQPVVRGDGLVLRPWERSDAPAAVRAFSDPDIARWHVRSLAGGEGPMWIEERRARWAQRSGVDWAVAAEGAEDAVLGRVAMHRVDLRDGHGIAAYWVLPEARGQRLAARALTVMSEWAFRVKGVHRISLEHSVANGASCRVAARAGFALEGTERRAMRHADGWHDMHLHARLADDPPLAVP